MTRKNEGKIALIMILALVAFVIGSAIGISVSIGENENQTAENNTTHYENVTVEMTSNLNKNKTVDFDSVRDSVDYNNNQTLQNSNVSN